VPPAQQQQQQVTGSQLRWKQTLLFDDLDLGTRTTKQDHLLRSLACEVQHPEGPDESRRMRYTRHGPGEQYSTRCHRPANTVTCVGADPCQMQTLHISAAQTVS